MTSETNPSMATTTVAGDDAQPTESATSTAATVQDFPDRAIVAELARQRQERLIIWASLHHSEQIFGKMLQSQSGRKVLQDEVTTRLRSYSKPRQHHNSYKSFMKHHHHLIQRGSTVEQLATADAYNAMFASVIRESRSRAVTDFRNKNPPILDIDPRKQWLRIPYKAPNLDRYLAQSAPPNNSGSHHRRTDHNPVQAAVSAAMNAATAIAAAPPRPSLDQLEEPLLLRIFDRLVFGLSPRLAAQQLATLDIVCRKFCYSSVSLTEVVARELCLCSLDPGAGFLGRSWKWSLYVANMSLAEIVKRLHGDYSRSRGTVNLGWKGIGDDGMTYVTAALQQPSFQSTDLVEGMRLNDNRLTSHSINYLVRLLFPPLTATKIGNLILRLTVYV